ncbi:sigma-70 family RNA polymerase sigma factor [Pseudalkalibacillus caeni]|uniref:RNA polymerase sigma factor n=1 Tax=Exobacillus caeni TaxID=2574798 RepID=A0A5R9F3L2_9BACL|nr:sigma-70 family RNA polymerase sigma factor [Pseudalkalibacillus caeni]TLS36926.1 sigma-70 family RNA polymerase sigma factor [Pseudalkalibacillus caeni]
MLETANLSDYQRAMKEIKREFDLLVEPYRPALWRYCLMTTGSPWDAEDLVQETLLKAYGAIARLVQPVVTKAYLFRIATNTWINIQKKQQPVLKELVELEYSLEEPYYHETREAMETLVQHLPPRQRVVVLLCDVFDFTGNEIAEIIGTTEGAVKQMLYRARTSLKKAREVPLSEVPGQETLTKGQQRTVESYIEAFNRRDPDAIARLMDENVVNDIVHTSVEHGKDIVRKHSLEGWANDPKPMKGYLKYLWNQPTIVVLTEFEGKETLYDLIQLEIEESLIMKKRDYYFCNDLLEKAAKELGISAHLNGYIYQGKDT